MKRKTILTLSAIASAAVIGAIAIPAIAQGQGQHDDGERQQMMRMMHDEQGGSMQDHRGGRPLWKTGPRGMTGNPVYQSFDVDGDGTVTPAEREAGLAALHAEHDADGNGTLSSDEFAAMIAEATRGFADRRFAVLDADEDGQISAGEMTFPQRMKPRMHRMHAPAETGQQ